MRHHRTLFLLLLAWPAILGQVACAMQDPPRGSGTGNPPGLLVVYGDFDHWKVAALTFAGKQLPVPLSVRGSPLGLSPDSQYVARIAGWNPWVTDYSSKSAVEVGPVKGGSARVVLAGTGAAYAWSPDGQRLAASASSRTGATLLRLFNPSTGRIQSLKLPRSHATSERAFFRILSWSPDSSHLLLEESNPYDQVAVVALDLRSKRLSTLATFGHKDEPAVVWSPNGRYIALASGEGFASRDYVFAVIDVATGDPLMECTGDHHCAWVPGWPLAWASDSRSLFVRSPNGIERLDLAWHHSLTVTVPPRDSILHLIVTKHRLAYNVLISMPEGSTGDWLNVSDTLYQYDLATHKMTQLLQVRGANEGIAAVRTLQHLP